MTLPASIFQGHTFNQEYIKNQLKNTSFRPSDNFRMFDTSDDIYSTTRISKADEDALKTKGLTKGNPDSGKRGMWIRHDGGQIEHAFDDIYKKLACCLGKGANDDFPISIIKSYKLEGGKVTEIETEDFAVKFDTSGDKCKINGVDYKDSNNENTPMNTNCLKLIERLVAFLNKHEPNPEEPINPLLAEIGPCVNNALIPKDIVNNAALTQELAGNRECSIAACKDGKARRTAFLTESERKPCTNTICIAKLASDNATGQGNVNAILSNNNVTQNCGASDLAAVANKGKTETPSGGGGGAGGGGGGAAAAPAESPISSMVGSLLSAGATGAGGGGGAAGNATTGGADATAPADQIIAGVDNMVLFGGVAVFVMFMSSSSLLALS